MMNMIHMMDITKTMYNRMDITKTMYNRMDITKTMDYKKVMILIRSC